MVAQGEVGVVVPGVYLVLSQPEDSGGGDSVQQDDRTTGAHVDVNGVVVEATVELFEMRGFLDEHRGRPCSGGRRAGAVGDTTLRCPVQEGPDLSVSPGTVGQPVVDVTLIHGRQGASPGLEPREEFQCDADLAANACCPRVAEWLFGTAGSVQEVPDGVAARQLCMFGRTVR